MAATPKWKVYSALGEYVAACKHAEDAACLVALYGDGATIRLGHNLICWREGGEIEAETGEPIAASQSYDYVASVCEGRALQRRAA